MNNISNNIFIHFVIFFIYMFDENAYTHVDTLFVYSPRINLSYRKISDEHLNALYINQDLKWNGQSLVVSYRLSVKDKN